MCLFFKWKWCSFRRLNLRIAVEIEQAILLTQSLAWLGLKIGNRDSLLCFEESSRSEDVPDASSKCSFAEWACWTSVPYGVFQGSRFKDSGPTSLWAKVPQTCHCQESNPSQSWGNLRSSRDTGRRVPYSFGTSTTTGSNRTGLCPVVLWR